MAGRGDNLRRRGRPVVGWGKLWRRPRNPSEALALDKKNDSEKTSLWVGFRPGAVVVVSGTLLVILRNKMGINQYRFVS